MAQFEFAFKCQFQVVVKISSTTYTALGTVRQSVEREAILKLRVVPGANKNPRPGGWLVVSRPDFPIILYLSCSHRPSDST